MVILACLACDSADSIPPQLASNCLILKVPSNGICFWTCLWLAKAASQAEILGWHIRPRSALGFSSFEDTQKEVKAVKAWASQLPMMPEDTRERLEQGHSAEHGDIGA